MLGKPKSKLLPPIPPYISNMMEHRCSALNTQHNLPTWVDLLA